MSARDALAEWLCWERGNCSRVWAICDHGFGYRDADALLTAFHVTPRVERDEVEDGSPETLRQAAARLRDDRNDPFSTAVADLLDVESGKWDAEAEQHPSFAAINHAAALAAARAYLGESA